MFIIQNTAHHNCSSTNKEKMWRNQAAFVSSMIVDSFSENPKGIYDNEYTLCNNGKKKRDLF